MSRASSESPAPQAGKNFPDYFPEKMSREERDIAVHDHIIVAQDLLDRSKELARSKDPVEQDEADSLLQYAKDEFVSVVKLTYRDAYALAFSRVGPKHNLGHGLAVEQAEDVVQEAYFRAFRHLQKFDKNAKFTTWLYRIVVNCSNTLYKRERKHSHGEIDEEVDFRGDHTYLAASKRQLSPEQFAVRSVTRDNLVALLGNLNPRERELVVLKTVYDMSYAEIIEMIGEEPGVKVENKLKVRHHRAMIKLKVMLEESGVKYPQQL